MILTAEEFLENVGVFTSPVSGLESYLQADVKASMIEFAKLQVEAALKAAGENAKMLDDKECWRNCSCEHPCKIINKESILNAYSLENIK